LLKCGDWKTVADFHHNSHQAAAVRYVSDTPLTKMCLWHYGSCITTIRTVGPHLATTQLVRKWLLNQYFTVNYSDQKITKTQDIPTSGAPRNFFSGGFNKFIW